MISTFDCPLTDCFAFLHKSKLLIRTIIKQKSVRDWDKIAYLGPNKQHIRNVHIRHTTYQKCISKKWIKKRALSRMISLTGWMDESPTQCQKDALDPEAIEDDIYTIS